MITEDELKKYLPKYLSEENYNNLLTELKSFPYNIDNRMYTYSLDNNIIYQGDGIKEMPIIDLANIGKGVKITNCLILSNTCDMDIANNRLFPASIMYAPIINLANYISVLYLKFNHFRVFSAAICAGKVTGRSSPLPAGQRLPMAGGYPVYPRPSALPDRQRSARLDSSTSIPNPPVAPYAPSITRRLK